MVLFLFLKVKMLNILRGSGGNNLRGYLLRFFIPRWSGPCLQRAVEQAGGPWLTWARLFPNLDLVAIRKSLRLPAPDREEFATGLRGC